MEIKAYKSEYSGEIFEHKKDYDAHIRSEKRQIKQREKRELNLLNKKTYIENITSEIKSIDELFCVIYEKQKEIALNLEIGTKEYKIFKNILFQKSYIQIEDKKDIFQSEEFNPYTQSISWSNSVSNYHSCPRGEQRNWGGYDKSLPTSFPGWRGVIYVEVHGNKMESARKLLSELGVHCGSGSANNNIGMFTCEVFAKDFPKFALHSMINELREENVFSYETYRNVMKLNEIKEVIKEEIFESFLASLENKFPKEYKMVMANIMESILVKKSSNDVGVKIKI